MHSDTLSNLDALSVGELRHLYETYRPASQLFGWRAGQPWANERSSGLMLDNDAERCLKAMDAIFAEARKRNVPPCSIHSDDVVAIWALRIADELGEIGGAAEFIGSTEACPAVATGA